MKQPQTSLPYEVYDDGANVDIVPSEGGEAVAIELYREDAEYIVEACNNYPEAINLLKKTFETMIMLSHETNYSSRRWHIEHVEPVQKFLNEIES